MVVSSTVRAATHRDDPSRLGHLIVDLSQGRCHLVCKGSGHNHDVRLSRRGTENDTQAILIVAGCGKMHHLESAAGETECHGPEGALTCPVGHLIKCGAVRMRQWQFSLNIPPIATSNRWSYSAYCMAPFLPSWLGSGTSRRANFMGGGVPGFPATKPGFCIGVALFDDVEDMKATLPARNGSRAVVGLAINEISFVARAASGRRVRTSQGH